MSEQAEESEALESEAGQEPEIPSLLPVLPLRETVVFPESMSPLAIGQERSIKLIDDAMAGNRMLALLVSKDPEVETPGAEQIHAVGTAAVIHRMLRIPDGTIRVLVQGLRRVRLERLTQEEPYLAGEFEPVPDVVPETPEVEALSKNVQGIFSRIVDLAPYLPSELELAVANVDTPGQLTYLIASTLRLPIAEKQELLEEANVEARLRRLSAILGRELESFELGAKIQSQVQSEMEASQREYFLRQQLKAIQEELGEGDADQAELAELRRQLDEAALPEEADRAARRELDRLSRLPSAAAEYGVIRTYLDWILSLPWNTSTEDNLDLKRARRILDEDHYDLEKVKERIVEYLAVSKLKADLSGPILCFVGPPGVGKTSLGQSIARTLDRKFVRISVGGVRDESEIRGHRRTYIGAMPGTVVRAIRDAGARNPVFMIDEIDKMGADWRGDPASAMLEVLDPGAALLVSRSLPRPAVRPVEGAVHLHREPARADSGAAARPHGDPPARRLHGGREGGDRPQVPDPEAARGERPREGPGGLHGPRPAAARARVHAGGRRPRPRPPDRRALSQDGQPGGGGQAEAGADRREARALVARAASLLERGAQADLRPRRRDRPGRDRRRRRRALRRGDRRWPARAR